MDSNQSRFITRQCHSSRSVSTGFAEIKKLMPISVDQPVLVWAVGDSIQVEAGGQFLALWPIYGVFGQHLVIDIFAVQTVSTSDEAEVLEGLAVCLDGIRSCILGAAQLGGPLRLHRWDCAAGVDGVRWLSRLRADETKGISPRCPRVGPRRLRILARRRTVIHRAFGALANFTSARRVTRCKDGVSFHNPRRVGPRPDMPVG